LRIGEVVPEVGFVEAVTVDELEAAAEIVICVHIARQRLESREDKRDGETE
jgi:hypothetical protein